MKAKTPKQPKVPMTDEQKLAVAASSPMAKSLSAMAGVLSLLRDKAGELMDPVKRVCYPPLAAAHEHAHKHATRVSDPIHKVCYEPLKGHWERKYKARYPKHHNKLLIIDIVLAGTIAALIVGWAFSPYLLPTSDANVLTITVHTPAASVSGSSTTVGIDYTNLSAVDALPCTVLVIEVPDAFADAGIVLSGGAPSEEADPSCQPTDVAPTSIGVPLPALAAGMTRTVSLSGVPYGLIGSVIEIPASISYWTIGGTEPTVVPFHVRLPITSASVGVDVSVPETILRGAATAISLSYHNDSLRAVPDAAVRFVPPADFVTTGSAPRATSSGLWHLGDLEPGARGTIVVSGTLRAARGQAVSTSFGADLLTNVSAEMPITASTTRVNADSLSSGLTLTQDVLGGEARFLRPGDEVTLRLTVTNDGDRTFTDGSLHLSFTDALFILGTGDDAGPMSAWTPEQVPQLASIAPGDTFSIETRLTVRDAITPSVMEAIGDGNAVASFASLLTVTGGAADETILIDTSPIDIPIATALRLQAAGIYFTKDGDQLGRGPLPPTVGETTRYRIVVQIDNAQNAVEDATFEAFLPEGVEWTGKFSITHGEAVDYFPSTRRVTWKIPAIEAFTAENGAAPGASFEVALTPSAANVGTAPALLTGLSVSGTDVLTDVRVAERIGDITTRLPFDFDDARSVVSPAAAETGAGE